jgi:phosphopantetheinyl transferase
MLSGFLDVANSKCVHLIVFHDVQKIVNRSRHRNANLFISVSESESAQLRKLERNLRGCWLLETVVSKMIGAHGDADIQVLRTEFGKPYFQSPSQDLPQFNLSYSDDCIAIALCWAGSVGVDIELSRTVANRRRLMERFFPNCSALQKAAIFSDDGSKDFLELWCITEAIAKCSGEGLAHWLGAIRWTQVEPDSDAVRSCSVMWNDGIIASVAWSEPQHQLKALHIWRGVIGRDNELEFEHQLCQPLGQSTVNLPDSFEYLRFWMRS